jgi:hypothetical protein
VYSYYVLSLTDNKNFHLERERTQKTTRWW